MAIEVLDLDPYEQTLDDDEEPKTVFLIQPLDQFEYFKMASLYNRIIKFLNIEEDDDFEKVVDFFNSDEAVKFKKDFYSFMKKSVLEIRNAKKKDGTLVTFKQGEFDPAIIPPMNAMKLLARAIFRVTVSEEEEGN